MIVYQFNAPHPYDEVFSHIERAIGTIGGKVKVKQPERGRMICGIGLLGNQKIEFFVENGQESCKCRATSSISGQIWNKFIVALGEDWGMKPYTSTSPLYVTDLLYMGDDVGRTAMSVDVSSRITYYKEGNDSFKKNVLVRLRYSNGMVQERVIGKNSPLYQELMARFK